jgi:glutaredoxin
VKAKELLNSYSLSYSEKIIGVNTTKEELKQILPDAKTVPQIFINKRYIGGYEQLVEYLESCYNNYGH